MLSEACDHTDTLRGADSVNLYTESGDSDMRFSGQIRGGGERN
jgi:hypothetical protein